MPVPAIWREPAAPRSDAWRRRDQAVQVACSCRRRSRYLAKTARSFSRPRTERSVLPAKVCDSISSECRRTNSGLCRNAAGMCFTFIQRSARQRRNSISSADTCSLRTTAVVPYSATTSSIDDQAAIAEVSRHRRSRIRRRMLDVRPVDVLPGKVEIGFDRRLRIVRVADDQAADDDTCRCRAGDGSPRGWRSRSSSPCRGASSSRAPSGTPDPRRGCSRCPGRRSGSRRAASTAPAARRAARAARSSPARCNRDRRSRRRRSPCTTSRSVRCPA